MSDDEGVYDPEFSAGWEGGWTNALFEVEAESKRMHSKTNEADHRVVMRVLQRVRDRAEA